MQVGIVLGSRSQWPTMQHTAELLASLGITYEARIITANKSANKLHEYASNATDRGMEIIIAGSTSTAYLPGILASRTQLPVLDVPIKKHTKQDEPCNYYLQNDTGNPVEMHVAGPEGAINAALFAASMLARKCPNIRKNLINYLRHSDTETGSPDSSGRHSIQAANLLRN